MNSKDNLLFIISAVVSVVVSVIVYFISSHCAYILLILGLVQTAAFYISTKRRYKKISVLNDYLALVCAGNYDLDMEDNAEGELSILKNNLYKVIVLLRSSNEELKKEKQHLADSIADISHQLKTPLTSMLVATDLLRAENDIQKSKNLIDIVESQTDKMTWLVATLLKFSKLDSGIVEFSRDSIEIESLIDSAVKPFELIAELKEIEICKDCSDFEITGDFSWTSEAIQNIIKNCIEHTERNGKISILSKSNNIYDEIIIRDNGLGIPEEDLPHIFERFYHGKNSSSESVGVGLALSKAILNKQNAVISAESTVGKGTSFFIKFYKTIV